MFRKPVFLIILILVLSGCSSVEPTVTVDLNLVESIVAATLGSVPTQTQVPLTDTPQAILPEVMVTDTPTATPSLSLTPSQTPTLTLSPTSTLVPGDPAVELGDPTWKTSFTNSSSWYTYDDDQASFNVEDGALVLTAKLANNYDSWSMASPKLGDFYLEFTVVTGESCQGKDRYGLIVRAPDPNQGYLFGVSCDGFYRLRIWDGDQFTNLTGWKPSETIQVGPNQTNRIGLKAEGDQLFLYINGQLHEKLSDDTFDRGAFGAFIAASETPGFTVKVTEAAYWDLP
jgi:hypothetical protein